MSLEIDENPMGFEAAQVDESMTSMSWRIVIICPMGWFVLSDQSYPGKVLFREPCSATNCGAVKVDSVGPENEVTLPQRTAQGKR